MAVIIRLQNLPLSANAVSIRGFFEGLKIPDGGVNIVGGVNGDAFIAFETDDDARRAMLLSGCKINGAEIKLLLSSKNEMHSIVSEAQKSLLKRASISTSPTPSRNIENTDKKSITYFDPPSYFKKESFDIPLNKVRVIDYKNKTNNYNKVSFNETDDISNHNYKQRRMEMDEVGISTDDNIDYNYNRNKYYEHDNISSKDSRNGKMLNEVNGENKDLNFNKENNIFDDPPRPSAFSYKSFHPIISNVRHDDGVMSNIPRYSEFKNNFYKSPLFEEARFFNFDYDLSDDDSFEQIQLRNFKNFLLPTPDSFKENYIGKKYDHIHHDYSVRPPWLEETMAPVHSITETVSIKERATSSNIVQITDKVNQENSLVRIVLPTSIINNKTVFDLFRNISIVPKQGIKIELDVEKRFTGYVYIMLTNQNEATKALKLNSTVFRGFIMSVESISDEDFGKVVSESEDLKNNVIKPFIDRSPYYRDLCVEISNIPLDITERDLKDYLDISINNKKMNFLKNDKASYCLINADNETMMESILKFNGVSYRGSIIKIIAISKHQLKHFLSNKYKEIKNAIPNSNEEMYCIKIDNIYPRIKPDDLNKLFWPSVIPIKNIIVKNSEGVVNLINPSIYKEAMDNLKSKPGINYLFTPITVAEFETIKSQILRIKSSHSSETKNRPCTPPSQVRIKNFPTTITNIQIKDFIRNFPYQPRSIRTSYENGKCIGEVILIFKRSTEAVDFKDEFHGQRFKGKELEVLLS